MNESIVGALSVEITGDNASLVKAMQGAGDAIRIGTKQIRSQINEWGKWSAGAIGAITATSAALIKSNLSNIRELKNLSFAANTSVAEFQRMAFGAQQFGIEQDKLSDILKDFNDRVGDFTTTGAGPMVDFFEQIGPKVGVTIDDFQKLSGPEGLQLFVSSLEKANLSQQEMTFHMEAIASDSTMLLPLLRYNGKAMSEQAKAAKALGIGLSEIDVKKAEDAQRQLDAIGSFIGNELMIASAELAPVVAAIATSFRDAAEESGSFGRQALGAFEAVGPAFSMFLNGFKGIHLAFKSGEVFVKEFLYTVSFAFEQINKLLIWFNNTLVDMVFTPIREAMKLMANFSSDAEEWVKAADALGNSFKGNTKFASDFAQAQREGLQEAKDALHELAMEKLPSQQFDDWLNNVKAKIDAVTEEVQAELESKGVTGKPKPDEKTESPRIAELNQETIGIMEALGMRYSMQEEAQLAALNREKELLDQQYANKEIGEQEHQKRMGEIKRQAEEVQRQMTLSNVQDGLKILLSGSKAAQKVVQNAALWQALVKGKEAAVSAWSAGMATGGPLAPLTAAAYTTASLAKTGALIQSIRGGGSSSVSAPSASLPSVPSGSTQQTSGENQVSTTRNFNVNFGGDGLMSTSQVQQLMEQISEQMGDGFNFSFSGG